MSGLPTDAAAPLPATAGSGPVRPLPGMRRKIGVYRRWSTPNQNGGYRNDQQFSAMDRRCAELGYDVEHYDDKQASGGRLDSRPECLRMLADLVAGKICGIAVLDTERLSRDETGEDIGKIIRACQAADGVIITPDNKYDASSAIDLFMLRIFNAVGGLERATIKKRMIQGKTGRLIRGLPTNGSTPPRGYKKEPAIDNRNGRTVNQLVKNQDEERDIFTLFEVAKDAPSFTAIATEMNRRGMYYVRRNGPRKGETRPWTERLVKILLNNLLYSGRQVIGKDCPSGVWKLSDDTKDGPVLRYTPELAYIDVDTHDYILERLNSHKKYLKRAPTHANPLLGVLRCRECGHSMYVQGRRESEPLAPNASVTHFCSIKKHDPYGCPGQTVREYFALGAIFTLMRGILDASVMADAEARAQEIVHVDHDAVLREARDRKTIAEQRLDDFIRRMKVMEPSDDELPAWKKQQDEIRAEIARARDAVLAAEALRRRHGVFQNVAQLGDDFLPKMLALPWLLQRDIIRAVFTEVRLVGDGATKRRRIRVESYTLVGDEARYEAPADGMWFSPRTSWTEAPSSGGSRCRPAPSGPRP